MRLDRRLGGHIDLLVVVTTNSNGPSLEQAKALLTLLSRRQRLYLNDNRREPNIWCLFLR